jgi:hypothetical protein
MVSITALRWVGRKRQFSWCQVKIVTSADYEDSLSGLKALIPVGCRLRARIDATAPYTLASPAERENFHRPTAGFLSGVNLLILRRLL